MEKVGFPILIAMVVLLAGDALLVFGIVDDSVARNVLALLLGILVAIGLILIRQRIRRRG